MIKVFLIKSKIKRFTITMTEFKSSVPKRVDVKNQHFHMCVGEVAGPGLRTGLT